MGKNLREIDIVHDCMLVDEHLLVSNAVTLTNGESKDMRGTSKAVKSRTTIPVSCKVLI